MTARIYETEKNSRFFLYSLVVSAFAIGVFFYVYTRPLAIEAECSEIASKTSGLTKSFGYDPLSDYDQTKTNCISKTLDNGNK